MISRRPRLLQGTEWLRRRLVWTAVLVVVCFGGAGLVTAVDRPHTEEQRPELSWTADRAAQPWLDQLLDRLEEVEPRVAALSNAGRRVLIGAAALQPSLLEEAIDLGHDESRLLSQALSEVTAVRAAPPPDLDTWRLGDARRDLLTRMDEAIAASEPLPDTWRRMADTGGLAIRFSDSLRDHDELVLQAMAAGTEARWSDALALLEEARLSLDAATAAGEQLAPAGSAPTLDELLARHAEHDAALVALYEYVERTDPPDEAVLDGLRSRVDAAQPALPTPADIEQAAVAEAAGRPLGDDLAAIEEARGRVADALRGLAREEEEEGPE